jgi:hypothetical protein
MEGTLCPKNWSSKLGRLCGTICCAHLAAREAGDTLSICLDRLGSLNMSLILALISQLVRSLTGAGLLKHVSGAQQLPSSPAPKTLIRANTDLCIDG